MDRQNRDAKSSAATIATSAQVMFGPILEATKPKKTPHGAHTMNIVPMRLFQSVPAGRGDSGSEHSRLVGHFGAGLCKLQRC